MIRCLNCNALIDHEAIARMAAQADENSGEFEDLLGNLEVAAAPPVKSESELHASMSSASSSGDSMTSVVELLEEPAEVHEPNEPHESHENNPGSNHERPDSPGRQERQIPEVTWIPPDSSISSASDARNSLNDASPRHNDLDELEDLDEWDSEDDLTQQKPSKLSSLKLTIPENHQSKDQSRDLSKDQSKDEKKVDQTRQDVVAIADKVNSVDEQRLSEPAVSQSTIDAKKAEWDQARKQVLEKVKQVEPEAEAENKNASFEDMLTTYESRQPGISEAEREKWRREAEEKEAARRLHPAYFDPEQKKNEERARTGIKVSLRFLPLLFWLFSSEARVDINGDPYLTPWGEHFIPLEPGTYEVTAYWRFLFLSRGGKATLSVDVKRDQEKLVKYFVWMPFVNSLKAK